MGSTVRQNLQSLNEEFAKDFEPHVINTPSTGLVYKAVLYKPPDDLVPGQLYAIKGKSGRSLTLLPFAGAAGEPRPMSFSQLPDHPFHKFHSAEEVYAALRE